MVRDRLRNRFAGETNAAIKDVALRQLAAGGPAAVSVNAIARELRVSGPALYRYYSSRDELLDDVISDAYADLAAQLETAIGSTPAPSRLAVLAESYRGWALAQPHRYRLLYAPVLPSFDPHAASLAEAAQQVMDLLLGVLADQASGVGERQWPDSVVPGDLRDWAARREVPELAPYALQAVLVWTRLHGLVGLEIDGNYTALGVDPSSLYRTEAEAVLDRYPLLPAGAS